MPQRMKERPPGASPRPESWPKYSSTRRLIWDGVFRVGRTSMKRKSWTLKAWSRMAHSRSRPVHHLRSKRRGVVAFAASYSRAAWRRMSASVATPMTSDPFNRHIIHRAWAPPVLELLGDAGLDCTHGRNSRHYHHRRPAEGTEGVLHASLLPAQGAAPAEPAGRLSEGAGRHPGRPGGRQREAVEQLELGRDRGRVREGPQTDPRHLRAQGKRPGRDLQAGHRGPAQLRGGPPRDR